MKLQELKKECIKIDKENYIIHNILRWADFESFKKNKWDFYKKIVIPKKSGDFRILYSPNNSLKRIQKIILKVLSRIKLPEYVHGFTSGKSIKTHSKLHSNKRIILTLDIKNFFGSVRREDVKNGLLQFTNNENFINLISILCTYKNSLPQGAPTSPILANMAFLHIDKKLNNLALNNSGSYSRYADDLTISSNDIGIYDMIRYIENIINSGGFYVNRKKTRYITKKNRQLVTGVVVNSKNPQPSKNYRYNFKAELFNIIKYNKKILLSDYARLIGKYKWIKTFNSQFCENQLKKYLNLIKSNNII